MLISYKFGAQGLIVRAKILATDQATPNSLGKAGLLFSTAGLNISTICDNEATPTVYSSAGATTQTVAALGTYAAPAATKCSFKELDNANHIGVYEMHFANARFALANGNGNAKYMIVTIAAIAGSNSAQCDFIIPLTDIDPYSRAAMFQAAASENYGTVGSYTYENQINRIMGMLGNLTIAGTLGTVTKWDHITTAFTLTYNASSNPSGLFIAT